MPMPSSSQAMTSTGIELVSPSSASPAASTRLDSDSTGPAADQIDLRGRSRGPSRAAITSAAEKAPKIQFEETPRSRAIGSARIAGR